MKFRAEKILVAAFALAILTGAAMAQGIGGAGGGGRHQSGNPADKTPPKPKVDDKDYKAALQRLPDKKFDAWQGVR